MRSFFAVLLIMAIATAVVPAATGQAVPLLAPVIVKNDMRGPLLSPDLECTGTAASQAAGLLPARRSRFLAANALPVYDCSKKSASVCLAPGSPGTTCCGGQCVDTVFSPYHCGGCNKVCKNGRGTCCGGRCVDLDSDKDNCGRCGNQCSKKCNFGFCDYA